MGNTDLSSSDEVRDLCARYALALDERDWNGLAAVFTANATMTFAHVGDVVGVSNIADTCQQALDKLDASQHLIGSILPTVNAAEARCVSYFQAQHVRKGAHGGDHCLVGGRYDDQLVRQEHGWRIVRRTQSFIWISGNERVLF